MTTPPTPCSTTTWPGCSTARVRLCTMTFATSQARSLRRSTSKSPRAFRSPAPPLAGLGLDGRCSASPQRLICFPETHDPEGHLDTGYSSTGAATSKPVEDISQTPRSSLSPATAGVTTTITLACCVSAARRIGREQWHSHEHQSAFAAETVGLLRSVRWLSTIPGPRAFKMQDFLGSAQDQWSQRSGTRVASGLSSCSPSVVSKAAYTGRPVTAQAAGAPAQRRSTVSSGPTLTTVDSILPWHGPPSSTSTCSSLKESRT